MPDMLSALMAVPWMSFWKKGLPSAQLPFALGLITKGLEDNTTKELLEPWSSEAKIPS